MIRGAELKVCQPSLNKCTHINRLLQLLVPFEVTQDRTPDEKEITNRTDQSIKKLVRPRHVAAQNADIYEGLLLKMSDHYHWGECRVNITLICEAFRLV